MRFLVDAQLPPAFAAWLRGLGHEAIHVVDAGLGRATDRAIWDRARRSNAVIVSKDEDFADLVRRSERGPAVLWVRIGDTTSAALLRTMAPVLVEIVEAFERGERLIEID